MDFTLSKEQQMAQKMYHDFAENEVKPLAKKVDAEEYFSIWPEGTGLLAELPFIKFKLYPFVDHGKNNPIYGLGSKLFGKIKNKG